MVDVSMCWCVWAGGRRHDYPTGHACIHVLQHSFVDALGVCAVVGSVDVSWSTSSSCSGFCGTFVLATSNTWPTRNFIASSKCDIEYVLYIHLYVSTYSHHMMFPAFKKVATKYTKHTYIWIVLCWRWEPSYKSILCCKLVQSLLVDVYSRNIALFLNMHISLFPLPPPFPAWGRDVVERKTETASRYIPY